MSLDDFKLSPQLMVELYENSLILPESASNIDEKTALKGSLFQGKNKKNILILVEQNSKGAIPADEMNLLTGILSACSLSLDDVALVESDCFETESYQQLMKSITANTLLFFGVNPENLGFPIHFPENQILRYNQQSYLRAPTLAELLNNKMAKATLWKSLKQLFSV